MGFRRFFSRRANELKANEPGPVESTEHFESVEDGDRMIVQQLRGLGANLSLPREVLHYLYLPTEPAAAAASEELRKAGFTTKISPAAGPTGPNPWLVLATTEEIVSVESARVARETFTAIAATHGGEYDGWEAGASP
jgi:hypothetical protein